MAISADGMRKAAGPDLGDLLQELVNRISHRGGRTLVVMAEGSVTLQQVLLLNRLFEAKTTTSTKLAAELNMSLSAVSQMIDRLHQQGLIQRREIFNDRRKRAISLTREGEKLVSRIREARSAEYRAGVAGLSAPLRAKLAELLRQALVELAAEECQLRAGSNRLSVS